MHHERDLTHINQWESKQETEHPVIHQKETPFHKEVPLTSVRTGSSDPSEHKYLPDMWPNEQQWCVACTNIPWHRIAQALKPVACSSCPQ